MTDQKAKLEPQKVLRQRATGQGRQLAESAGRPLAVG
jgi:hypothetical protein